MSFSFCCVWSWVANMFEMRCGALCCVALLPLTVRGLCSVLLLWGEPVTWFFFQGSTWQKCKLAQATSWNACISCGFFVCFYWFVQCFSIFLHVSAVTGCLSGWVAQCCSFLLVSLSIIRDSSYLLLLVLCFTIVTPRFFRRSLTPTYILKKSAQNPYNIIEPLKKSRKPLKKPKKITVCMTSTNVSYICWHNVSYIF